MPDGTSAYTRDGALKISADGTIVTSDGYIVEPEITIPEDAKQVTIRKDGQIEVTLFGDPEPTILGQIELARFINPAGLEAIGHSNVDVVSEMVHMIEAQRAYELNSKTIKTTEDLYRIVSQLKR